MKLQRNLLIDTKVVLVIEAGRMSSVANNEWWTIEMHAALITPNKQVRALAHWSCAVDGWRCDGSRSVGWASVNLEAIVCTIDTENRQKSLVTSDSKLLHCSLSLPNHSVECLRDAKAENVEHLSTVVLSEVVKELRGGLSLTVELYTQASVTCEHFPTVVAAIILVHGVRCCSRSSRVNQVDQSTSISSQRNSLFPHLCVAPGEKRLKIHFHNLHDTEATSSCPCFMWVRSFESGLGRREKDYRGMKWRLAFSISKRSFPCSLLLELTRICWAFCCRKRGYRCDQTVERPCRLDVPTRTNSSRMRLQSWHWCLGCARAGFDQCWWERCERQGGLLNMSGETSISERTWCFHANEFQ